jgi:hypothetical protein
VSDSPDDDVPPEPAFEDSGPVPVEVPEADAIEQRQSVAASGEAPDPSEHGWEASEADVWEQRRDAELDDEDTPR